MLSRSSEREDGGQRLRIGAVRPSFVLLLDRSFCVDSLRFGREHLLDQSSCRFGAVGRHQGGCVRLAGMI